MDVRLFPAPFWADEYGREITDDRVTAATLVEPELSMDRVREMLAWTHTAPLASPYKMAIIRLDHERSDGSRWRASRHAEAALLKTLEEPPAGVRFVLLATRPVTPMIASRCVRLQAGLLSTADLTTVLERVTDLTASEAAVIAELGGGRVAPALRMHAHLEASRQQVVEILTFLARRDQVALIEKMKHWSDEDTMLLTRWAYERLTGRWRLFADVGVPDLPASAARAVLLALGSFGRARPRLQLGALAAMV